MRIAIAAVVALVAGLVAGLAWMNHSLGSEREAHLLQQQELEKRAADAEKRAAQAEARLDRLAQQRDSYEGQMSVLQERLNAARAASLALPEPASSDASLPAENDSGPAEESQEPTPEEAEEEARREEWRERRRAFASRMRDGVQGYLADEYDAAKDPVVQERLASMSEYTEYMFDLRRQMGEAETEEERDALRERMMETGQEARGLVQEHQRYLLQEALRATGNESVADNAAALDALQQTLESPYFRGGAMMGGGPGGGRVGWGGGPGGGRGGWGGGGGRGPR